MVVQEVVTAAKERINLVVVTVQNYCFASMGALRKPLARHTSAPSMATADSVRLDGDVLPIYLGANLCCQSWSPGSAPRH